MTKAVIFDKDGTLFGFNESWGPWCAKLLNNLSSNPEPLAAALGFDLEREVFHRHSQLIASAPDELPALMLPHLPDWTEDALLTHLVRESETVQGQPACDLEAVLSDLRAQGLVLGVVTNDAMSAAQHQLAPWAHHFDFMAGYDSGFGAKPAPGQLFAFCEQTGIAPADCVMVGDSTHDIDAGRAAGMRTVGVLTGPANAGDLQTASVVMPSIADLSDWLGNAQ